MKKYKIYWLFTIVLIFGCKKFLDEKPNIKLTVPETVNDLQALLDQYQVMNQVDAAAGEVSNIDYYLTDADYATQTEENQRMYIWDKSDIFVQGINDWYYNYRSIYRANSVLEFTEKIQRITSNASAWDNVAGQGYFYRAKNFLSTLFIFSLAYSPKAEQDLGIPLRLSTDFNVASARASVEASYRQVISDLKKAIIYLPVKQIHVLRPSKPAAYALLSRTYWSMRDYENSYKYADSCLQLKSDLIDYNTLVATATFPISQYNIEILHDGLLPASILNYSRAKISSEQLALYESNDLRSTIFFRNNGNGTFGFKGSYEAATAPFSGLATDEVYLIRAECLARLNRISESLNDLNTLVKKRYKVNSFIAFTETNQQKLIALIIKERRKELLMRGLRWIDIKRLNLEGANLSIMRTVKGKVYILEPESRGFALPLPSDILATSGLQQNTY